MNLAAILKDSNYKLSQFTPQEADNLEKSIVIKQTKGGDVAYVKCLVHGKKIKLTPEEAVRQLYLSGEGFANSDVIDMSEASSRAQ